MVMDSCKIAYKGLSNGLHDFEFKVDGSLFEQYEYSEVHAADCTASVQLNRSEQQLLLDVKITGSVVVPCDRCLEDCTLPIDYEGELVVKFSDEEQESDGEIVWLYPGESELDLAPYIYESIVLALPYQRVHEEGKCNPEMLKYFDIVSEEEFAAIEAAASDPTPKNSEWEKLAALKQQMEQED